MSVLLETIADRTATHAMDLASIVEEDLRGLKDAPDAIRLQAEVAAARVATGGVSSLADILAQWKGDLEEFLGSGLSGHDFRFWADLGERLSQVGVATISRFKSLWDQLDALGAAPDTVRQARESLSATQTRILEIKNWADKIAKLARRIPPEADPALIEAGAEAIRQGRFKTTTQILESLRNQPT
jgi:hypothetical protein